MSETAAWFRVHELPKFQKSYLDENT